MSCSTQHTHALRWPYLCVSFSFIPPPCFSSSCYLKAEPLRPRLSPARHLTASRRPASSTRGLCFVRWKPSTPSAPGLGLERCSWIFNEPIVLVFEWIGTTRLGGRSFRTARLRCDKQLEGRVREEIRCDWSSPEEYWGESLHQPVNWDLLMSFIYTDANKNETEQVLVKIAQTLFPSYFFYESSISSVILKKWFLFSCPHQLKPLHCFGDFHIQNKSSGY